MSELESVLAQVEPIEGWLRPEQAGALWHAARAVPQGGQIVEIGSFRAKSTIVLAKAAAPGVVVHAIDPHAGNDRAPGEWVGTPEDGQADHQAFGANLSAAGVADRVVHVREFSQHAQAAVDGPVDLLYIDGAHGFGPARSDIVEWGARVRPGGTMVIHDAFASVFVTLAIASSLFGSARWRYEGRERSLAIYRRADVSRLRNLARQLACLPWFARNVVIKALSAARVEGLARLVGHRPGSGVY